MKLSVGNTIRSREVESIVSGYTTVIPHPTHTTHIQFRRFAGCPICNLHLQSFITRWNELDDAGIAEIVVFHSSKENLLKHHASAPFPLIADPTKSLYKEFGVERSLRSLAHPRSWVPAIKGLLKHGASLPGIGESPLGLPADFLIHPNGKIAKMKYGQHANDQWSVDELLALVTHEKKQERTD